MKSAQQQKEKKAIIELVFAASLWGFGFVATRWATELFDAYSLNVLRFFIATVAAGIILLATTRPHKTLHHLRISCLPGIALGLTLIFQTIGIKYTSVAKCAFITTLYIVVVPIFEKLILNSKLPRFHFIWVILALSGAALMCRPSTGNWNQGDLITLVCAVTAALQIVEIERVSALTESAFLFNTGQGIWAGFISLLGALFWGSFPPLPWSAKPLGALFILALASTLLAFLIQIRAQRVIRSSTVSLLFLLESPFAAVYGYWILGEGMTLPQIAGAAIVCGAALAATKYRD